MTGKSPSERPGPSRSTRLRRAVLFCFWAAFIILCAVYRKEITVERIVNYTPKQPFLAALALLAMFALKSVSGVLYGGILYVASGLMLPLPAALLVNVLGTAIALTPAFYIGRRMGAGALTGLIKKHPRLESLQNWSRRNERFLMMIVRVIGHLPSDAVSIYFGASSVPYGRYLFWSLLGMLPSVIIFSVIGGNLNDPGSPEFLIAAACKLALAVLSLIITIRKGKRHAS